ncbi:MAG: ribonuclease D [Pseudomonadota bacterium]
MDIIRTTDALRDFTAALRAQDYFAIDTEFMRERTYWPILCLIQAAAPGVEAIIDPLAEDLDLAPLGEALADPSVVQVFHAARQDVEIFYRQFEAIPTPLFDTQIAAMACGFGDQIGYEPLMRKLLGASIDKGSRFTDWARRPLSEAQLAYALSDVTHLREAYPILRERLENSGRLLWVEEEIAVLDDPSLYYTAPEDAWRRMKVRGVRPKEIGPLMKLAEWREREAQTRDMPRGRIVKDDALFEFARLRPGTPEALARARSAPNGFERSNAGAAGLEAVAAGAALPRDALPDLARNENRPPAPADVVELLKVLLKTQSEAYGVAPKMIASVADLEALALDDDANVPALKGWRREVFGDPAIRLKRGEVALKLKDGAVRICEAP